MVLLAWGAGCDDDIPGVAVPAPPPACTPGETTCDGGWFLRCAGDGLRYVREEGCATVGLACHRANGCVDPVVGVGCGLGEALCKDGVPWRCGADGQFAESPACDPGQRCLGAGHCAPCDDGEDICLGAEVWRCDPQEPRLLRQCDPAVARCEEGRCRSLCDVDDRPVSHQGCQFWAVDLENVAASDRGLQDNPDRVSPADAQFAVAVANVASTGPSKGSDGSHTDTATVAVRRVDAGGERIVEEAAVPPGGVHVFELEPSNVQGSALARRAYRITSDLPVVAYQFNPLNNGEQAFSNDASLLLPQAALGTDYVVTTGDAVFGRSGGVSVPWGAFVAVVGTTEDDTRVTVQMVADFEAPDDPAVQVVGRTVTAVLGSHAVLSLRSLPLDGGGEGAGNLSGVRVQSDRPVAVFAGNVATLVPHVGRDDKCCADHLEEQFLPTSAWGRSVLGAGAMVRNPVEPEGDLWRITAGAGGARLSFRPDRPQGAPTTLAPYASAQFETSSPGFLVDEPVQLVHFVKSSHNVGPPQDTQACDPRLDRGAGRCSLVARFMAACDADEDDEGATRFRCAPVGDPAMTGVPPRESWRKEYVFLTPDDYAVDFALVLAAKDARIELDGVPVDSDEFEEIVSMPNAKPLGRYVLPLTDGGHALVSDKPVGLMVFGYDRDVSYGYPGGMDLGVVDRDL